MRRRIFRNLKPLTLASQSPRRKELLANLGLVFSVEPAKINEPPPESETPKHYALKLARLKANEVASQVKEGVVLAADTIVVYQDEILGKPQNEEDAFRMLELLSGNKHEVFTAYIIQEKSAILAENVVKTEVFFKKLTQEEIKAYLATDEPWDKAGAYAIQGLASYMVKCINGSVTNVIGLPLTEVIEDLLRLKVITYEK
ncbi:maf protein [Thermodesulfatator indicus DSM 15286]|uniref:dTTP/UTP pyrophosphatase n=1 Tax=Thermodesulfatator indicus (strain DSM 15286 / JCM 11887 / CIR29812) TaxID=667014 RepID=F8AAB3_THEID|nr:Maf family protein [Thermodesulfatator indicus]AEH44249.1 maf protein [Thermodesulfatator indicus DSM 15286]